jgi:hypothetical protein
MSGRTRGYRPTEPPEPPRLTLDEFAQFKKMFEDSSLAWWIKAAGVGAIAEALHICWLLYCYLMRTHLQP